VNSFVESLCTVRAPGRLYIKKQYGFKIEVLKIFSGQCLERLVPDKINRKF
jgi:hypothetical protein